MRALFIRKIIKIKLFVYKDVGKTHIFDKGFELYFC